MITKQTNYVGGVFNPEKRTHKVGGVFNPDALLKFTLICLLTLGTLTASTTLFAAESIKFATLAPKGSTWMNNFEAMAREIRDKTNNEIGLRIYPNGVQGDELDVIRKMRAGLIHAGAMTATGLGEIQKEVLIFQLPRMFRNYEELDHVRDFLREDLDKKFMDAGYVLIGMGDIGFYYIFSNEPIRTIADIQSQASRCGLGRATESHSNSTKTPTSQPSHGKLHRSCLRSIQGRSTP